MENASKALIIAGAILLSILIIGVGIAVFTSAQGTIDSSMQSMDSQEVQAFNSQFTSYEGTEVSGSNVKALLTSLAANLGTYSDEPSKVPTIKGKNLKDASGTKINVNNAVYNKVGADNSKAYANAITAFRNAIINKHTYKVTMSFDTNGIINTITIEDVTK